MQNLKYQMRKNKKYTLPTRSFIRIAYHKKLQKKTWENDFFLKKKKYAISIQLKKSVFYL